MEALAHLAPSAPAACFCLAQIVHRVIVERARPEMPPEVPPSVARLAQDCWGRSPEGRPSFERVEARLRAMLEQLQREGRLAAGAADREGAAGGLQRPAAVPAAMQWLMTGGDDHVTDF